jgi:LysR family glycine cleavage system transcriptional activator
VLRVSATHSFALKWLAPRSADFGRRHPDIDLRLDSSDSLANLTDGSCDVAIRYSASPTEGRLLFQERLAVIYSPALAASIGRDTLTLSDLARAPLIYEGDPDRWKAFLGARGLAVHDHHFARAFSHAGLLVQAAVAGNGVALAPLAIASADLADGRLRALRVGTLPMAYGYRAVVAAHAAESGKVQRFLLWLEAMFEAMRSGLGEGLIDSA